MNKFALVIANLIIPIASFYMFTILNYHGPSGNEALVMAFYIVGVFVIVFDLIFIFKKKEYRTKKNSFLNILFLLLTFIHLAINSIMFFLVLALFQL